MNELISSGLVFDIALVVIALEVVALFVWARRSKRLAAVDVVFQVLAGGLLMAAVRCAVTGVDPRVTLSLVALSLPAHLVDLYRRLRTARQA